MHKKEKTDRLIKYGSTSYSTCCRSFQRWIEIILQLPGPAWSKKTKRTATVEGLQAGGTSRGKKNISAKKRRAVV